MTDTQAPESQPPGHAASPQAPPEGGERAPASEPYAEVAPGAAPDAQSEPAPDFDFRHHPHDQYFKSSLSRPELAADLLVHYLPPEVVALLDLQALRKEAVVGGLLLRVTLLMLQAVFRPALAQNLGQIAALLRQIGDRLPRELELRRVLAYAAAAGRDLEPDDIAAATRSATPEKDDTMARTLLHRLLAEGRAEGIVEGRVEGRVEGILEGRFGAAGMQLLPAIRRISHSQRLEAILEAARNATSIEEVRQALQG